MRLHYTERFRRSYESAPPRVRHAFDKQAAFLVHDLRHPSLRAKKYDEANDMWQARVNDAWRFYFKIQGKTDMLLDIIRHPKQMGTRKSYVAEAPKDEISYTLRDSLRSSVAFHVKVRRLLSDPARKPA